MTLIVYKLWNHYTVYNIKLKKCYTKSFKYGFNVCIFYSRILSGKCEWVTKIYNDYYEYNRKLQNIF